MRPARMMGGGLAGGGPITTKLVIAIAVVSVVLALLSRTGLGDRLEELLLFSPGGVLGGRLWQVLTYAFVHPLLEGGFAVLSFVFALLFLWSIGGQLEAVLGSKRFLGLYLGLVGLGALVTIPFALLLGAGTYRYHGVWVALSGLIILFAESFPGHTILFSLFIPVRGRTLILLAFGFLGLWAIVKSPVVVLPEFFTMVAALAYTRGLFRPRRAWLRFRAWRIERELRRRSSHLSVIPGERDRDRGPHAPGSTSDREGRGPWLH